MCNLCNIDNLLTPHEENRKLKAEISSLKMCNGVHDMSGYTISELDEVCNEFQKTETLKEFEYGVLEILRSVLSNVMYTKQTELEKRYALNHNLTHEALWKSCSKLWELEDFIIKAQYEADDFMFVPQDI